MPTKILGMRDWETRVHDVYHMAEACRMSADALSDYVSQKIAAELTRKHGRRAVYSAYMQGFVRGLRTVREARIQNDLVEYCYVKNGVLFSTHKDTTHRSTEEFYASDRGCELGSLPSGFYWKGTDKPYHTATKV